MFGASWRVARIAGIEIRVDSSWLIIVLLIAYSMFLWFGTRFGVTAEAAVVLGIASTALFFASVLLHELAHAITSKARGVPVRGITLFLFGGATHAKLETRRPVDEFFITVVGPLTSLALGGLFWILRVTTAGALPEAVARGMFGRLAFINLALGVFNLLPGFPLDGGRILRSAVWRATGSLSRATRVASVGGQVVGYLLIGGGVLLLLTGDVGGGLWIAAIGWFLSQAAVASAREQQMRRFLADADAEDVMARNLVTIPGDLSLRQAVDEYFMRYDHGAFPVEDGGQTIGLLTLRGVRKVDREEWLTRTVRETMTSLADAVTVSPTTPMPAVLDRLEPEQVQRVLVVDDGNVTGMITSLDVARWIRRRQELG